MNKEIKKWRSPSLGRDMELVIYGTSGTPILGFPTRGASCYQWGEFGMVNAISYQIENGYNQLFCVSSIDGESFLNKHATPRQRLVRHHQYELYLVEEVVPYIEEHNAIDYLIVAGTDLGGYHAINTALKYPFVFDKAIGMSGIYDIKGFLHGYYEDDVYYNNPTDYIPNLSRQSLLDKIRDIDFRLVSYSRDPRIDYARRMSNVFRMKFIRHELDIWDKDTDQEWDQWQQMLKTHII
ncbi:esterase family protein [Fodinibius sediminis]|uniref:Esterase/lipase superfamily enzyme n=1 Tax=Fodinibius sediminis TaxID=1214077 RepID=A0A521E5V6_9BACT|nr:alpha/beta hydrolase-fold protein [Fodinibius sediminis]SMO79287.1 Esterase/lipase superfamily enzyme [Fodinibius sediminis]